MKSSFTRWCGRNILRQDGVVWPCEASVCEILTASLALDGVRVVEPQGVYRSFIALSLNRQRLGW